MEITQDVWGYSSDGEVILLYTMTNPSGASVQVTNLGAALISANVPDLDGKLEDVVLGYKDYKSYFNDGPFMGKTVGRYANRIGGARFTLDGKEYRLTPNEGQNQLHGGPGTLANKVWEARVETNRVVFSIMSPDGDQGFPGNLTVETAYHWSDKNELEIVYSAETDAPTVVNFTNHAYFNLYGESSGTVLRHYLQLNASNFVPTRSDNIPTGEIRPVEGTPMDFRAGRRIGTDPGPDCPVPAGSTREYGSYWTIPENYRQIADAKGYDRCWVIDGWKKNILTKAGSFWCIVSGRKLSVFTSQPGIQVYTGNFLHGSPTGKSGHPYDNRDGIALECQGFPDAPNHPDFPDQTLRPGERYIQKTVYKFEILK